MESIINRRDVWYERVIFIAYQIKDTKLKDTPIGV
jgi:hypothetical protein